VIGKYMQEYHGK